MRSEVSHSVTAGSPCPDFDLIPVLVAVLFARKKTAYRSIPGVDIWDAKRDARNYAGRNPVVAHPPCRAFGKLKHFSKPRPDEIELAVFSVAEVRRCGGVLEHPAHSSLWQSANLPLPGSRDEFGGFTWPIHQSWFGHRGHKATWLYVVGIEPRDLPPMPFALVTADRIDVEHMGRAERERTPLVLAQWLVELATRCVR